MPHEVNRHWDDGPDEAYDTLVLPKMEMTPERATEIMAEVKKSLDRFELLKDALDLVIELWPKPGYASVILETHQWVKLRQVLLAIPEAVAHDE